MLRNSCVQQFHKISNWTILINREIGGNVKAFKIKLASVQCCLLQISRNVAIFERLPNKLFQVFFQDFENKSHAYLKNCILLLMVISPVAESRGELYVENLSQCAVWVCPWPGMLFLEGWGVVGSRGAEEGVCREGVLLAPLGASLSSLTATAPGAAVSQQVVVPPVLQLLVALKRCSAVNAGSLSALVLLSPQSARG